MRIRNFGAVGLLVTATVASTANAAVVDYSDFQVGTTTSALVLSLPQFDPSLGTLDGISVSATGTATGIDSNIAEITIRCVFVGAPPPPPAVRPQRCTRNNSTPLARAIATLDLTGPDISQMVTGGAVAPRCSRTQQYDPLNPPVFSPPCESIATATATLDPSAQNVPGTGFAAYTGTGTVDFSFDITTDPRSPNTLSDASVRVTYDYTPAAVVPLPAGLGLLMAGIGCLAALRRRIS